MSFPVYDFRRDIRNILVTPQIRSRFLRMEIGQVNRGHTHDLGHEVFLMLQGQAEFEIEGEKQVLGPGQLCVALVDENHIIRNVGDEPVIMYLSVTPHIQPTHTSWTEDGAKGPLQFAPSTRYDVPADTTTPIEELAGRQLEAADALRGAAESADRVQREQLPAFTDAMAQGDRERALDARDAVWGALLPMFQAMYSLAEAWNALTYRTAESDS